MANGPSRSSRSESVGNLSVVQTLGLTAWFYLQMSSLIRLHLHAFTNGDMGCKTVDSGLLNQLRGPVKEQIPRVRAVMLVGADMQQLQ